MSILEKCGAALVAASFVGNLFSLFVFAKWVVIGRMVIENPANAMSRIVQAFFGGRLRDHIVHIYGNDGVRIYEATTEKLVWTSGADKAALK